MPGKHNAGCCGRCTPTSECWFCAQIPTALVVTSDDGCCDWSGSYVLDPDCEKTYLTPATVNLACTGDHLGVGCGPYKNIEIVSSGGNVYQAICDYFYNCESGGFDRTQDFFLVRAGPNFTVYFDEVAGIPRARVEVRFTLGQVSNDPNAGCVSTVMNNRIEYLDTYETFISDCNDIDGLELTFIERTRVITGDIFGWFDGKNTDPDNITFGAESSFGTEVFQTVPVCAPATLSLAV